MLSNFIYYKEAIFYAIRFSPKLDKKTKEALIFINQEILFIEQSLTIFKIFLKSSRFL